MKQIVRLLFFAAGVIFAAVVLVFAAFWWMINRSPVTAHHDTPKMDIITYEVTSSGMDANAFADVTFENEDGGTSQQQLVRLPWHYMMQVRPGAFLYLSAQSHNSGPIYARICDGSKVLKESESIGQYSIAQVSKIF